MLIAFTGRAGSGKSTAADHLVEKYGYVKHTFAGPLKAMVAALGVTPAQITDPHLKVVPIPHFGNKSPREIMQTLGTEWGRHMIHPDIWVNAWKRTLPDAENIVVDDCRFDNEVEIIRTLGGKVIKMRRRKADDTVCTHDSEVVPVFYNTSLYNDGPRHTMRGGLDNIMSGIGMDYD